MNKPTFAAGEYYNFKHQNHEETYKVLSKSTDDKTMQIKIYIVEEKKFVEIKVYYDNDEVAIINSKPATAEQIATFKRAEHFASKGRKLDEFRVGDLCKTIDGYMFTIGDDSFVKKAKSESATLIQTAEELREVGAEAIKKPTSFRVG